MSDAESNHELEFMSAQHVAAMNAQLADAPDVLAAANELRADYVLAYRLDDAPDGVPIYWTMALGPSGVRFSLEPPVHADVLITSDWTRRMLSLHAVRVGNVIECPEQIDGDPELLGRLLAVVALGQRVATMPTRLPEVRR